MPRLRLPRLHYTPWRFTSSGGLEITGGELINVGFNSGAFAVRNRSTGNNVLLTFRSIGTGAGLSPSPINIDGSTLSFPGSGVGGILAINRRHLSHEDFGGVCAIYNIQLAGIGGMSAAMVCLGFRTDLESIVTAATAVAELFAEACKGSIPGILAAPGYYLTMLSHFKAIGFLAATSVGFQFGAGAMGYLGLAEPLA